MKKILVGFAILAVSTSVVMAKKKAAAPAAAPAATPMMMPGGGPTAADQAMYKKNLRDSGMKK
jgi:hypothetical protein